MFDTSEVLVRRAGVAPGARRPALLSRLVRRPAGVVGLAGTLLVVGLGLIGPIIAPHDPFAVDGPSLAAPSWSYPMGTDALGRDLFSGVLHGARTSLVVAAGVAAIVLVAGLAVGLVAGYRGGWVDDVLMRITEEFQVLPRFFFALVVLAFFGPGLDRLVILLGATSWPLLARVAGASDTRIVLREVLPHAVSAAVAVLGLVIA